MDLNPTVAAALKASGYDADPKFTKFIGALSQVEAGGRESDKGKVIKGPKTRSGEQAAGPLQIMPGTFAEMNQRLGGKLDIANNADLSRAGIEYAKLMYDRAGGNLFNAAKMYHGGPGAIGKNPKDTGTGLANNDYAAKTVRLAEGKAPSETPKRPKPASSDTRLAAAATELAFNLPSGSLVDVVAPAPAPEPARNTGADTMNWSQALASRLGSVETPALDAEGDNWMDSPVLSQVQTAAAANQDVMLASIFPSGDNTVSRQDVSGIPSTVDRYLDRMLRA